MPGPPGSGVTSPARRNRTRSINRLSPVDVPSISEILRIVTERGTKVKEKVTKTGTGDNFRLYLLPDSF